MSRDKIYDNEIIQDKLVIIKNKALLALAYKIVDHFPEYTLFGGIVREIIAPAIISKKDPFVIYVWKYQKIDI